jgi:GT2 family glycosyltransferase
MAGMPSSFSPTRRSRQFSAGERRAEPASGLEREAVIGNGLCGRQATEGYDVSGSIVAYDNEPAELERAIRTFFATGLRVSLLVVDNSPRDSLRAIVQQSGGEYHFVGRNLGFGAGHNIALRRYLTRSRYHLVMNPDVYASFGLLDGLFEFMEGRPCAGLTMPQVLYPDGTFQRLCKRLPTPVDLVGRRFGLPAVRKLIGRRLERYELTHLDFQRVQSVPVLSGCCMFLRVDALKDVGLFDERYFMYLEDVDLCRRMRRSWDTLYCPDIKVFHEYAKGSYKRGQLRNHHIRSAIRYFNKWGWLIDKERDAINSEVDRRRVGRGLEETAAIAP